MFSHGLGLDRAGSASGIPNLLRDLDVFVCLNLLEATEVELLKGLKCYLSSNVLSLFQFIARIRRIMSMMVSVYIATAL